MEIQQQSQDWHAWRKSGLGASDAPVIMKVSPYRTPYQLWEEKTGRASSAEDNWATRRGQEFEPRIRAEYELLHDQPMPPTLCEHKEFPFIRASLDGMSADGSVILEIKCAGKESHEIAERGEIPEKYWPQVQHQLLVTGASRCDYFSFFIPRKLEDGTEPPTKSAIVQVTPDQAFCKILLAELFNFWALVQTDTPPPFTARDFRVVRGKELVAAVLNGDFSGLEKHPRWRLKNKVFIRKDGGWNVEEMEFQSDPAR